MANYVSGLEDRSAAKTVMVDGIDRAPPLANFFARNGITPIVAPAGYRDGPDCEVAHCRKRSSSCRTISCRATNAVRRSTCSWCSTTRATGSQPSIRLADTALRGFSRETGVVRAIARGLGPQLLQPVNVDRVNIATPKQQAAILLFIIPMFGLLGSVDRHA